MNGTVISLLSEGDLRTIGAVERVTALALKDTFYVKVLIQSFSRGDQPLNMRIADALEKVSRQRPEILEPYRSELVTMLHNYEQKEIRWHMAQVLPRLNLTAGQTILAVTIWKHDVENSKSSIVRACSLQAIYEVARKDHNYNRLLANMLNLALSGTPATRARARLIMRQLGKQ